MPAAAPPPMPLARLIGCGGAGVLVALAMPPWGFWPLAFVGIVCFELALGDESIRSRRAWAGLAFGLPWMVIGMAWMWFLTAPGYLVTSLLFASLHAAAAAIAPTGRWRVIGRPAAHTLAEIVRMLVPFGGVPLATIGISQAGGPLLAVARVGGVILLTWLVFQIGVAIAQLLRRLMAEARSDDSTRPTLRTIEAAALAAAAVVVLVALVAPSGTDRDVEPLTVAAVQGGGEQGTSALDVPSSRVTRAHLDATATIRPGDELDVVVWPENGIDVNGIAFDDSEAFAEITAEAARLDVPFAVGVTVDSEFSAHPTDGSFVNAQVIVTPEGDVTGNYEKVRIVPFGEYVPLRGVLEALGAPLDQIPSDALRGRDPAVIALPDGARLGVMISWEVFFGDRGRAAADADILLNPTNGASYTGTIVQTQQVASSRLRAMETGRWVVQVSPTGFSAFVSPDGDVFQRTDVSEQRVITMDVPLRSGSTWYTSLGDAPWVALAIGLLLASLWFGGWSERFRSPTTA
ncbi:MAG: apolipoprotein N-acyltransferase [Ilumatobacteraceae bacterium]|nr:apolipoprotein N-acyltransferase [Ilumatobacteraceae bacterium]